MQGHIEYHHYDDDSSWVVDAVCQQCTVDVDNDRQRKHTVPLHHHVCSRGDPLQRRVIVKQLHRLLVAYKIGVYCVSPSNHSWVPSAQVIISRYTRSAKFAGSGVALLTLYSMLNCSSIIYVMHEMTLNNNVYMVNWYCCLVLNVKKNLLLQLW